LESIENWNLSNVTDLPNTFSGCSSLISLNLSGWGICNVSTLQCTFYNCTSLTYLDLSNWIVDLPTGALSRLSYKDTFSGCTSLETLKTPTTIGSKIPSLPYTMYDWDNDNKEYTKLPGGNLMLHKTKSDATAINHAETEQAEETTYFNASGQRVSTKNGLSIVKLSNGKVKKVYVK